MNIKNFYSISDFYNFIKGSDGKNSPVPAQMIFTVIPHLRGPKSTERLKRILQIF